MAYGEEAGTAAGNDDIEDNVDDVDTSTGGSAGPGEQGGDTIDPDTGEISGGSAFDDDDDDDDDDRRTQRPSSPSSGGSDDDSVPTYDGEKTRLSGPNAPGNTTDSVQRETLDEGGDEGRTAFDSPERDDPYRPDADSQGVEEGEVGAIGDAPESSARDQAVERLQGRVDREIPGVAAVETDEYNIRRTGDGYEVVLTDRGLRDARASARAGQVRGNGVVGNDADPDADGSVDPFDNGRQRRSRTRTVNDSVTVFDNREPRERDVGSAFDESGVDSGREPQSGSDPGRRGEVRAAVNRYGQRQLQRRRLEQMGADPGDGPIESVVANAAQRTEARRRGVRDTPNDLGDTPATVTIDGREVRVEALLNEAASGAQDFTRRGAALGAVGVAAAREQRVNREQEAIEFVASGGQQGFESTRSLVDVATTAESPEEVREAVRERAQTDVSADERRVEQALSGAGALPSAPADIATTVKEAGETAVYTTGGTPAAGGSEEEFDRRVGEVEEATASRANAVQRSARQNPFQVGSSLVFGSAAEVAAVGAVARGARAGRVSSASRAGRAYSPDVDADAALQNARQFASDQRGQADLSGLERGTDADARSSGSSSSSSRSTGQVKMEELPDEISSTDPTNSRSKLTQQRPGERSRVPSSARRFKRSKVRQERLRRERARMRIEERTPDDDLRDVVDAEQRLREKIEGSTDSRAVAQPSVGPAVGGLLGSSSAVAREGQQAEARAVEEQDRAVERALQAQRPRQEAGQTVEGALARAEAVASPTDTDARTELDSRPGERSRVDVRRRLETGIDTRQRQRIDIDTRQDTQTDLDLERIGQSTDPTKPPETPPTKTPVPPTIDLDPDGGSGDRGVPFWQSVSDEVFDTGVVQTLDELDNL